MEVYVSTEFFIIHLKVNKQTTIAASLWLAFMIVLHGIDRSDFHLLQSVYTIAFVAYAWLLFKQPTIGLTTGLTLALTARLIGFVFDPLLSDDYFRFVWDGMLSHAGVHPMAYTPSFIYTHPEITNVPEHLYVSLNSQNYYSVYPPVAQWVYALSYKINGMNIIGHIIFYKIILIITDTLICYFLYHLLRKRNLPVERMLLFALSPLIIIEFTGNLHMDGLMIAGLLGALVLLDRKNMAGGIALMIFSVLAKLLTIVLIPFMPKEFYWKKISLFFGLCLAGSGLIIWLSFGTNTGWMESVSLWFTSFEFNAGLYYLARYLGYSFKGYNTIALLGPVFAAMIILGAAGIWWKYIKSASLPWPTAMLFVLTLYFLLSTTVHPWYLGILLTLSVLSLHTYPVIWTYLAFLSYSHYMGGASQEQYGFIALEYSALFVWMIWEWSRNNRTNMGLA